MQNLQINTVKKGLDVFEKKLVKPVSQDDIERLLEIRIKRISRFDIDRQHKEIKEIKSSIKEIEKKLKDTVGFTISYLDGLLKKYGRQYPRRTTIDTFTEVKARKVALSNLTVGYHRETGLLGYHVKSDCDLTFSCSEYDKILLIHKDGRYKVIKVPEKVFVDHDIYLAEIVKGKTIYNVLYREGSKSQTYIKRFATPKFILDKEYRLFPANKKSWIQFLQTGEGVRARIDYIPSKRSKINSERLEFDDYLIKGAAAIGKRLSTRTVRRISELSVKLSEQQDGPEVEKKEVPPEEFTPHSPQSKQASVPEKKGDDELPETENKKIKSQLGLFDIKKKD
jgi:topoisomerase-4 subunit A